MAAADHLPAPASRHAVALLRFPDERTDWVIVFDVVLTEPLEDLQDRVARVHDAVPVIGARLDGETWRPGPPPAVVVVEGPPLELADIDRPFDLTAEPPLRLAVSADGLRLALAGHHAALDGLGLVAILNALTGGPQPAPVASPPPGEPGSKLPLLARLARPADRVAATPGVWPGDRYDSAPVELRGPGVTATLAEACAAAAAAHNQRHHARFAKVGITVPVGGPAGVGNVASYRRVDVATGDSVADAVQAALATPDEPGEQVAAPKALMALLRPVVERFSDSILVSNLGRHDVPGVRRIDFYPVARGRSAVCFASCTVVGAETSLTLRSRDLSPGDNRRLLADACARLASITDVTAPA